jgi:hypothetical protein
MYVHYRLSDNTPFYVGKGSGNRAWDMQSRGRNAYWQRTKNLHGIRVEIIFDNLTEQEAFQCEVDTILEFKYLGYSLTNLSLGGEGQSGYKFTDKQRLAISRGLKGRIPWNKVSDRKVTRKRPKATGDNNHFSDKTSYHFIRLIDGFEFYGTRSSLCSKFNVDNGLIKKLFYRVPRKSADGWRLKEQS